MKREELSSIKLDISKRNEEIGKAAFSYHCKQQSLHPNWRGDRATAFADGAKWADAHPHWISVEDEMPKDREMVLALGKFDAYFVACYDYLIESWFDENDTFIREDWGIAYWMPLPQSPKKGGAQ